MSIDVSIIICTRNRAASLGGTLKSLAAIDTRFQWEVLIVDNASTDDTSGVIASADSCGGRFHHLYESRIGSGAAKSAWRHAKGDILCFTDDDCYLTPDYIDAVMTAFAERPHAGCIGGRILLHDPTDAAITIDERTEPVCTPPYSFVFPGMLQGANTGFRRDALQVSGGFDPAFGAGTGYPCEDIDAVASVVWSGYEAWFDPRPLIYHHHRRKPSDVPNLVRGYDRGRGAFYAKWLGRREARSLFLRKWIMSPKYNPYYTLGSLFNEIGSALRFARQSQGLLAQFRIACVGFAMLGILVMVRLRGAVRSRHAI